jgi:hypothetical protein
MVKDPAYWQALGEFIEAFAQTETLLFNYLIALIGVSHAVGRALFSGDHVDALVDTVRRVARASPPDRDIVEKLEPALTQFKIINTTRNSIVHYVSMVASDKGRISSNITRARSAEQVIEFRASLDSLREMTTDLERVSQVFLYCQLTSRAGGPRVPQLAREDLVNQLTALSAAWLYIQPKAL